MRNKHKQLAIASIAMVLGTSYFIQSAHANGFVLISDDATGGECTTVGTWDDINNICTLTTDLTEPVVIGFEGATLDCDGYTIQGTDLAASRGVDIAANGVTVQNCTILDFDSGIYLGAFDSNTILDNTSNSNVRGIDMRGSQDNTIMGNILNYNISFGLGAAFRNDNTGNEVVDNTANHNGNFGFFWPFGGNNDFEENSANHNVAVGFLIRSNGNTLFDNTANKNKRGGIASEGDENDLIDNTANRNLGNGFIIKGNDNELDNNQASHNGEYGYNNNGTNTDFINNKCVKNGDGGSSPADLCSPQS